MPFRPADRKVHGREDGRRGVDGHGCADLVQGYPFEQDAEVAHGIDGHAHLAHLAQGQGVVRIVPDLGGEIEGHAQARLPLLQEIPETPVRILGGAEPGILAHGPEAAPVHVGLDPPGKGILAGKAEIPQVIETGDIRRRIERVHRQPGDRFKPSLRFRRLGVLFL